MIHSSFSVETKEVRKKATIPAEDAPIPTITTRIKVDRRDIQEGNLQRGQQVETDG